MVDERIARPQNDLISDLILDQVIPGYIDKDHALRIIFPMLVTATITNLICWVGISSLLGFATCQFL